MFHVAEWAHVLLNLNTSIDQLMKTMGLCGVFVLCVVIFCETGFIFFPFLPGDSLLFALGSLWARHPVISIWALILLLSFSAFLGDNLNYSVGKFIGPKIFQGQHRFLKKKYLNDAHHFYEKHGIKAIFFARFAPVFRNFIPFIAGIARMPYLKFSGFSLIAAIVWVGSLSAIGYWFGNIPWVQTHFSAIVLGIIFVSILPAILDVLIHQLRSRS